jgi:hypothetical protein
MEMHTKVLAGKPKVKTPLGTPTHTQADNI